MGLTRSAVAVKGQSSYEDRPAVMQATGEVDGRLLVVLQRRAHLKVSSESALVLDVEAVACVRHSQKKAACQTAARASYDERRKWVSDDRGGGKRGGKRKAEGEKERTRGTVGAGRGTHLGLRPQLDTRLRSVVDGSRNDQAERAFGAGVDLKLVDVDREGDVCDGLQVDTVSKSSSREEEGRPAHVERDGSAEELARWEGGGDEAGVETTLPRVVRGGAEAEEGGSAEARGECRRERNSHHVSPIVRPSLGLRHADDMISPARAINQFYPQPPHCFESTHHCKSCATLNSP